MSLDDIDKIVRCAEDVRTQLQNVSMPYELTLDIDSKLASVAKLVQYAKGTHAEEVAELRDIIEGLLSNWPHSEISRYYKPGAAPVLMKTAALERAAAAIRLKEQPQ